MFIVGVVDIGRGLIQYMMLTQITHEGARYLATFPDLNPQAETCNHPITAQSPLCPTDADHSAVHRRIEQLVSIYQSAFVVDSITTDADIEDPLNPTLLDDSVLVQIQAHYQGVFPFSNLIPIRLTARIPYLH